MGVMQEMMERQMDTWKKWIVSGLLLVCLVSCTLLFKAYLDGRFHSPQTLREYIAGFGLAAPLILVAIQAAQVVFPVLPGFLGCAAGAAMFGWAGGFWCNYIGISAGSMIAFLLARRYGKRIVSYMFPGERYEKWSEWAAGSRSYTAVLFLGMVLPLFPDDFFCYFTGITKMSVRRFATVILLGKPWCILAYSILFSAAV